MKKLMIVAATAAMATVASAASFQAIDCEEAFESDPSLCDYMVFKLTASGKTVRDTKSGYKKVDSLKVKKGALLFRFDECCAQSCCATGEAGICCYNQADLYATVKIGKETYAVGIGDLVIDKWSVFGKDLRKALNWKNLSTKELKKKVTLESDLFLVTPSGVNVAPAEPQDPMISNFTLTQVSLAASAFGKAQVKFYKEGTKKTKGYCSVGTETTPCQAVWTPKTYKGWFVGTRAKLEGDQACFNCECGTYEIFGGTWKAVYTDKYTDYIGAQKLAFGGTLFAGYGFSAWEEDLGEALDSEE